MTTVPSTSQNGWNIYTLKAYFEQRFTDSDKAVSAALQAAKEAVIKAELATEKRFDEVRREADDRSSQLSDKIDDLQAAMNRGMGDTGATRRMWAMLIPTVISVISVVALVFVSFHH